MIIQNSTCDWRINKMIDNDLLPDEDWSEKVEDPRELEWKNCYTPEERIAISKEILDNIEKGNIMTVSE